MIPVPPGTDTPLALLRTLLGQEAYENIAHRLANPPTDDNPEHLRDLYTQDGTGG